MDKSIKRPFLFLFILLILNLFLFFNYKNIFIIFFNILVFGMAYYFNKKKLLIYIFFSLMLAFSIFNLLDNDFNKINKSVKVVGKVQKYNYSKNDRFIIKSKNLKTNILVFFNGNADDYVGDIIEFESILKRAEKNSNPNMFNYRNYLKSKNIYYITFLDKEEINVVEKNTDYIYILRKNINNYLDKIYKNKSLAFVKGFLLGNKADLNNEDLNKFYKVGLGHILVISGLHFGILYFLINKFLSYFKIPLLKKIIIINLLLIFFLIITGLRVSALRAYIMIFIYEIIYLFNRKVDLLNFISFLAIIFIIINPFIIYSLSFILSFGAIFSIALFYNRIPLKIPKVLRIILSVQVLLVFINIHFFNRFNFSTFFINIFMNFIATFLFILIFANMFLYKFIFLTSIIDLIINGIYSVVNYFAEIDFFNFLLPSFNENMIILLFLITLLIIYKIETNKINYKKILIFFLLSYLVISYNPFLKTEVYFFDVGNGDSCFIRTKDNIKILIDTGKKSEYRSVSEILLKNGIKNLDFVLLTHNHIDHIGGMEEILKAHKIDNLVFSKYSTINQELKEIIKKVNSNIYYLMKDDKILTKSSFLEFYNPYGDKSLSENNQSLVFSYIENDKKILFTGDIEKEVERNIVNFLDNDYQILKVSHHGSNTSSSKKFLEKVSPKVSIIQVGQNNYGHPSKSVINRFKDMDINIYRNDRNGCIKLVIDKNIKVID
ncbi:MAG: DNA internalization-related competence protein ComEC/Rec2 [Bacillota bacterium]